MRDMKSALHAEFNICKTRLIILQIHDMPHHPSALDTIRQQLPDLAPLPLQSKCVLPKQSSTLRGLSHWPPKIHQRFFWMRCALDHKQNLRNCHSSRLLKLICSYSAGAPAQRSCIWLELPIPLWKTLRNNLTLSLRTILTLCSRLIRKLQGLHQRYFKGRFTPSPILVGRAGSYRES